MLGEVRRKRRGAREGKRKSVPAKAAKRGKLKRALEELLAEVTGLYRNEKLGERDAHELEKLRVEDQVRRTTGSCGTEKASRPAWP